MDFTLLACESGFSSLFRLTDRGQLAAQKRDGVHFAIHEQPSRTSSRFILLLPPASSRMVPQNWVFPACRHLHRRRTNHQRLKALGRCRLGGSGRIRCFELALGTQESTNPYQRDHYCSIFNDLMVHLPIARVSDYGRRTTIARKAHRPLIPFDCSAQLHQLGCLV